MKVVVTCKARRDPKQSARLVRSQINKDRYTGLALDISIN